jgi:hypothetical protein
MRSRLDAVMDDPMFRGEDGARLAARQTSTRSPRRSAPDRSELEHRRYRNEARGAVRGVDALGSRSPRTTDRAPARRGRFLKRWLYSPEFG